MNLLKPFQALASAFSGFFDKRLWQTSFGGRKTVSSEQVSEDSALNYSAVWCATRLLCGTGAGLPLPLYRGLMDENREKVREHPVFRLLNRKPNPEMTAFNFRSVMWQWQVNWGNAYAEIEREGDDPDGQLVNLWPIHPVRVTIARDESNELFYKVRDEETRQDVVLEPWRMLHIPSIITYDGIQGHGVIAHARESIGAGIAAEKYGADWFGQAAVPRAVIEGIPKSWNEESRDAFRKEWKEIHAAFNGDPGDRIALLPQGSTLKPITISNEDSQFLQTRQFSVEEIARWYGIPPHLLQHLLRATFNNIEELGISFVIYSLIEWLNVWEHSVSHKLLTEQEQEELFVEHNVDALMRGNAASRSSFYQTMVNSGLMTRNEARKKENLNPVPGGDTFVVQGAMVPLDEEGRPVSDFAGTSGGQSQSEPPPPDDEADTEGQQILMGIAENLKAVLSQDLSRILTKESKRVLQYAKKPNKFLDSVDAFYSEHTNFVAEAISATIAALRECGADVEVEGFVAEWKTEAVSLILATSGLATPDNLVVMTQELIASDDWKSRPERAIEEIYYGDESTAGDEGTVSTGVIAVQSETAT